MCGTAEDLQSYGGNARGALQAEKGQQPGSAGLAGLMIKDYGM